ncbi:uncharacterized protein LOC131955495 [Physella acuta]|uniref:uncharacterized protein LOC131955495 n=1 Tax=Physella acuta TaxID=109671 RepID=UPI0027DCD093|nr:uncharacterized protein LOC131955495 [Physella acuta]XP_059175609.1 uncharacterized protein LOC131955495 [Physella acuta]XP_059175610.1 uncharacterized protein LOC131955495 [Physella acuta]
MGQFYAFFLVLVLLPVGAEAWLMEAAGATVGALTVALILPCFLKIVGFTSRGIAGGSIAAFLMSRAAAYKIGMRAVAAVQAVGVTGVSFSSVALGFIVGGILGHSFNYIIDMNESNT